jgi:hypothetical protein
MRINELLERNWLQKHSGDILEPSHSKRRTPICHHHKMDLHQLPKQFQLLRSTLDELVHNLATSLYVKMISRFISQP